MTRERDTESMTHEWRGDDGAHSRQAANENGTDGLREHADRSPLAIALVDGATHVIRYANPAFERMSGARRAHIVGAALTTVLPPPVGDPLRRLLGRVQERGDPQTDVEIPCLCEPDGTPGVGVCWSVTVWPALAQDGRTDDLIVQLWDVTENVRERERRATMVDELRRVNERLVLASLREQTLRESEAHFRHQSLHDALTGLANRTLFLDRVIHALARAERDGSVAAVLFLDLDGFKRVNDTLGHAAGDQVLTVAAERLQRAVRAGDTVARFGGDEFAVLLEGTHAERATAEAVQVTMRIITALRVPMELEGQPRTIGASIGVAVGGTAASEELLRRADRAMYVAKARGGGHVLYVTGM